MKKSLVYAATTLLLALFGTLPVQAASPAGQPAPLDKPLPASAASAAQPAQSSVPVTPVLERFRTHTGPRTPAALTALFDAPIAANIRQQPAVVLSDGATPVTISVAVGSPDSKAPNVAFNGAQLISLKRSKTDEWDIEALPAAGTLNASLLLLTDTTTLEIPLTVAPPLPKEIDLSEQGFIAYLSGTGTAAQPLPDLNDDGRRDYLDDFIFTANYLVRPSHAADGQGAAQAPASHSPQQQVSSPVQDSSPPAPSTGQLPQSPQTTTGQSSTAPEATTGQAPYQRNISIRAQKLREMKQRLQAPTVAPPP